MAGPESLACLSAPGPQPRSRSDMSPTKVLPSAPEVSPLLRFQALGRGFGTRVLGLRCKTHPGNPRI